MTDWKKVDEAVNEAIERNEPYIIFKFIELEEYRYIQKVAEIKASRIAIKDVNLMILLLSVGAGGVISGIEQIHTGGIAQILTNSIGVFSFVAGLTLIGLAGLVDRKNDPQYEACNRIILNTERKILQMDRESKKA